MKRLLESGWKRLGLQLGLLTGIGLAFAVGSHHRQATADGPMDCPEEGECTFKKPNIMFIMDYSTAMNAEWDIQNMLTRWDAAIAAVELVVQPGSFLDQNTHVALMRFGHDPSPAPGSMIVGDASGLVDGNEIDVHWDDNANTYAICNGQAIIDALAALPPPMNGQLAGIGAWTRGALDAAQIEIDQTKADHPDDQLDEPRIYANVVLTTGAWTNRNGTQTLNPPADDPVVPATDMFDNQNIRTYVISMAGDPNAQAAADALANAGGTNAALAGDMPAQLEMALQIMVQGIIDSIVAPECDTDLPRVMVLLDASSAMLNIDNGQSFGPMGATAWDQIRDSLAGQPSLFDMDVGFAPAEDVTHFGLAVFGHDTPDPGEQKILVQYGPCVRQNFAWALDPQSSCELPGCDDPWGGPPITWTFKDGQLEDPPAFTHPTQSHMPACEGADFCAGSGRATHLGLQLIASNRDAYHQQMLLPNAQYPVSDQTPYFNILITNGQYDGYSTDAQVQAELVQMYDAGVTTYVIGYGDGVDSAAAIQQLSNMASWGSGGQQGYFDANTQAELETALASLLQNPSFNPCCAFNDCSDPPPTTDTNEPDPMPSTTSGDGDGEPTTGDGDGDPSSTIGDGDGDPGDGDGDGDGDASSGSDTGSDGSGSETGGPSLNGRDGCNCSSEPDGDGRGLLGSLLALGLFGLGLSGLRRRRA